MVERHKSVQEFGGHSAGRSYAVGFYWCCGSITGASTSSSPFALPCSFGLLSPVGRANAVLSVRRRKSRCLFVETYLTEQGTFATDRITDVLKFGFGSRAGAIAVSLVLRKPWCQETAAYCLCVAVLAFYTSSFRWGFLHIPAIGLPFHWRLRQVDEMGGV